MGIIYILLLSLITSGNSVFADSKDPDAGGYLYDTYSKLLDDLLDDKYKTNVIPIQKQGRPVEVKLGMSIQNLEEMDENAESMSMLVWINLEWNDHRLAWNRSEYNIESLRIPPSKIWQPDIIPYNVARPKDYIHALGEVVLYSDGSVNHISPVQLTTYCAFDLEYYPFDTQACMIKFGSWTYDGSSLNLTTKQGVPDTSTYSINKEWNLVDSAFKRNVFRYECCPEDYINCEVVLKLQRRSGILFHVYLGPVTCMAFMIPVVFLLPPDSNQKLVLGGSLLVGQVMILTMLPNSIPVASPPLILMFYLASFVLLCLALACSVVVMNMWSRSKRGGTGVPVVLNRIFLGIFDRLLCVKKNDFYDQPSTVVSGEEDNDNLVKDYSHVVVPAEWRQLAMVFDRLFMLLFFITCFIFVIVIFANR